MKQFFPKNAELEALCQFYLKFYKQNKHARVEVILDEIKKITTDEEGVDIALDLEFYYDYSRKHNAKYIKHYLSKDPKLIDLADQYINAIHTEDYHTTSCLNKDFYDILGKDTADYVLDALEYYVSGN